MRFDRQELLKQMQSQGVQEPSIQNSVMQNQVVHADEITNDVKIELDDMSKKQNNKDLKIEL